jgi:hypothetical protein
VFQIWSLNPPAFLEAVKVPLPENASVAEVDELRWLDGGQGLAVTISAWKEPDDEPHQHVRSNYDPATKEFLRVDDKEVTAIPVLDSEAILLPFSEQTASAVVPEALRANLPLAWQADQELRVRWRRGDDSHDVGCRDKSFLLQLQVRTDALITSANGLLQSWPLPPHDPKWPALGVAALCAAGSWWACAKRYARRMKQATIAPVAS